MGISFFCIQELSFSTELFNKYIRFWFNRTEELWVGKFLIITPLWND